MRPQNESTLILADAVESLNYTPPGPGEVFAGAGARLDLEDGTITTPGLHSDDDGITARRFTLDPSLSSSPPVSLVGEVITLGTIDRDGSSLVAASSTDQRAVVSWLRNTVTAIIDRLVMRVTGAGGAISQIILSPAGQTHVVAGPDSEKGAYQLGVTRAPTSAHMAMDARGNDGIATLRLISQSGVLNATLNVQTDDLTEQTALMVKPSEITVFANGDPSGNVYGTWIGHATRTGAVHTLTTTMEEIPGIALDIPAMGRDGYALVTFAGFVTIQTATNVYVRAHYSIGAGPFVFSDPIAITGQGTGQSTPMQTVMIPTKQGQTTRIRLWGRRVGGAATVSANHTTIAAVHYC